jgi:hypothetical protein
MDECGEKSEDYEGKPGKRLWRALVVAGGLASATLCVPYDRTQVADYGLEATRLNSAV